MALRLTNRVDLDVYYNAESARFDDRVLSIVTREAFRKIFANALPLALNATKFLSAASSSMAKCLTSQCYRHGMVAGDLCCVRCLNGCIA